MTVITATYNRPGQLAEAIDSVRSQTYSHWEHIVVSDGRDDRVPALVARYGDSRITAYHTCHLAVMGNYQRNFALQYATGEFVLYLDDDNVLYPDALAVMVAGFTAPDIGYVVCPIRYGARELRPPRNFVHRQIDLLNYMVRRRLVTRVGGQNLNYSADYYLIDAIRRISRGEFVDTLIGHHR